VHENIVFCVKNEQVSSVQIRDTVPLQVREWEGSSDAEEQLLVPDMYADKLGDLLDRIKDLH
jgi:hypothetical protein